MIYKLNVVIAQFLRLHLLRFRVANTVGCITFL